MSRRIIGQPRFFWVPFALLLTLCIVSLAADKKAGKVAVQGHSALCQLLIQNVPNADTRALVSHVIGQTVDMNSIRQRLEKFTGVVPQPDGLVINERGSLYARAVVRRLLFREFVNLGLEPSYEVFATGANVVATIRGTNAPHEVIEITGHYDSVGNPGADDNGSGLALVMELARLMKENPPERSVRFVFMDLEEKGFDGSKHHASVLKDQASSEDLIGVIVLDTIAWAPRSKRSQMLVLEVGTDMMAHSDDEYQKRVDFAKLLIYQLRTIRNRDGRVQFSVETDEALPNSADHGPYWLNGLPAVLIGEAFEDGLITPEYHKDSDTVENLNWAFYSEVSRIVAEMVAYVAGAQLPDSFQATTDLVSALAAKDDPSLRPDNDLPEALDRSLFLPPAPRVRPGGYSRAYRPQSKKAEEAVEWIEEHLNSPDLMLVSSPGTHHASFLVVDYGVEPQWLDISKLTTEELIEVADYAINQTALMVTVTPKNPVTSFKPQQRSEIVAAVINEKYDSAKYQIQVGSDLSGELIPEEEFDTALDMTYSSPSYLTDRIREAAPDSVMLIVFPDTEVTKRRGGLVIRDLDRVKYYTMSGNELINWKTVYEALLQVPSSGNVPRIIQIDAKEPVPEQELHKEILPRLWSAKGRGGLKYDTVYGPPDFLNTSKAGRN